ncbi:uncharacterized protein F5147DRAFT_310139 [Suillus discolor]|uniref:Uncharacterized protein n=1 Tax=Suillus discolor TaxID=1912936 RepID=A0A9P7F0R5_9AGAM|nr:uncharacterized protein F5147DRAFT_310139 [Suillus discolor]KAG2101553.1 hypothetical protein F5147DRAFT_310139 [Suillus discolor]
MQMTIFLGRSILECADPSQRRCISMSFVGYCATNFTRRSILVFHNRCKKREWCRCTPRALIQAYCNVGLTESRYMESPPLSYYVCANARPRLFCIMFGARTQPHVLLIYGAQYYVRLQPPASKRSVLLWTMGINSSAFDAFNEHSRRPTYFSKQVSMFL